MQAPEVQLNGLSVRYGRSVALEQLTANFTAGTVTGLIGRNAAGKSTLLATIAGFRQPSRGQVLIDGRPPFENADVMATICLVREGGDLLTSSSVKANLALARDLRSSWDAELADRLIEQFAIPLRKRVESLSRGQRSSLAAVIGLASRAPLTIFDEVYLGMDVPSRYAFYDALLAEQIREPRTVIISSHFLEEAEQLLEKAMILHRGRILLAGSIDELGSRGGRVIGPRQQALEFSQGRRILSEQNLGVYTAVSFEGQLTEADRLRAQETGLQLERLSLQDLYASLTSDASPEIPVNE